MALQDIVAQTVAGLGYELVELERSAGGTLRATIDFPWSPPADAGEERLVAGDCAGFRAGDADGHHLQNRSDREAVVLEIGTSTDDDVVEYPDIDLRSEPAGYVHKNGTSYE